MGGTPISDDSPLPEKRSEVLPALPDAEATAAFVPYYSALVLNNASQILSAGPRRYLVRNSLSGHGIELGTAELEFLRAFTTPRTAAQASLDSSLGPEAAAALSARLRNLGILAPVGLHLSEPPQLTVRTDACFFRLPFHDPGGLHMPADFCFLGVPYEGGRTGLAGASTGPDLLRLHSMGLPAAISLETGRGVGWYDYDEKRPLLRDATLLDAGNVLVLPGEPPMDIFARVSGAVAAILRSNAIPVVLGGDHSITAPVLRGFGGRELTVVHFDAHSDLEDVVPPGILHHGNVIRRVRELPGVRGVLSFGLRGLGSPPPDVELAEFTWTSASELRKGGVEAMLMQVRSIGPVYVTVDLDVLDPAYMPAVGTPLPGGLSPMFLKELLWCLGTSVEVLGFDFVELSPRDEDTESLSVAAELILTLAGAIHRRRIGAASP